MEKRLTHTFEEIEELNAWFLLIVCITLYQTYQVCVSFRSW